MSLSPALLSILACPDDKGPLFYVEDDSVLYNPRLGRTYPVVDGIPVMLIEEATTLDTEARAALDAKIAELALTPTFEA
ncbi:MAG TPA: Trm112 family protein [Ilumatobacter sp.]|nr:Trm112 family protein [Ilumatobacter sp.]